MHLFYTPDILTRPELPEEEAGHCLRVLRLTQGDEVMLTDGRGSFYRATIAAATGKRCLLTIEETLPQKPLWLGHLHLALAPTKNMDRMEWLVEKATEIGVDEISFLDCRFSERRVVKTERIEKIVVSAMKQSLKATKPVVNEMISFDRFLSRALTGQRFLAHCYKEERLSLKSALQRGQDATVLIGPEGDFSPEEVEKALQTGFRPVTLGPSRLRTETAALVACHLMNLVNQIE